MPESDPPTPSSANRESLHRKLREPKQLSTPSEAPSSRAKEEFTDRVVHRRLRIPERELELENERLREENTRLQNQPAGSTSTQQKELSTSSRASQEQEIEDIGLPLFLQRRIKARAQQSTTQRDQAITSLTALSEPVVFPFQTQEESAKSDETGLGTGLSMPFTLSETIPPAQISKTESVTEVNTRPNPENITEDSQRILNNRREIFDKFVPILKQYIPRNGNIDSIILNPNLVEELNKELIGDIFPKNSDELHKYIYDALHYYLANASILPNDPSVIQLKKMCPPDEWSKLCEEVVKSLEYPTYYSYSDPSAYKVPAVKSAWGEELESMRKKEESPREAFQDTMNKAANDLERSVPPAETATETEANESEWSRFRRTLAEDAPELPPYRIEITNSKNLEQQVNQALSSAPAGLVEFEMSPTLLRSVLETIPQIKSKLRKLEVSVKDDPRSSNKVLVLKGDLGVGVGFIGLGGVTFDSLMIAGEGDGIRVLNKENLKYYGQGSKKKAEIEDLLNNLDVDITIELQKRLSDPNSRVSGFTIRGDKLVLKVDKV